MLWGYANLAHHTDPDLPIYGIQACGEEEFSTLEDMATHYVEKVRAFQPVGPYYLGGYCFGGNVAQEMARQLGRYLQGWHGYFGACQTPSVLKELDQWIRRRLRSFLWKQWKRGPVRYTELTRRGVRKDLAVRTVKSPRGPWHLAASPGLAFALPNAYFTSLGIPQLFRTR